MQKTQVLFPQDLYEKHLSLIQSIHFTRREIDVIACLLSARGTSKTAFFLSIDPRTVETHIRNIMSKLECNSREGIIDFIEASDKALLLRKYYSLLQINVLFEKSLKDISKLNREKKLNCFLMTGKDKVSFFDHLKSHLILAGITVSNAARKKERDYVICILPQTLAEDEVSLLLQKTSQSSNKALFLLQERKNHKETPRKLIDCNVVDFAKYENYYFSFFTLLQKILPHLKLDEIISEFKDKYKKIHVEPKLVQTSASQVNLKSSLISRVGLKSSFLFFIFVLMIGSGFLALRWNQQHQYAIPLRSDLVLPKETAFLQRPDLLKLIDNKFKEQKKIQTVALVGQGGAGKTTLARQYAHQQKTSCLWEINAETPVSLQTSFERLSQGLATTENDKKILKNLLGIKNPFEKEERIIQFVKEHLKEKKNWFLIYDNVEAFTDIQEHFPNDAETWGEGKVLLTTRDSNIENNSHVDHALFIGELTPQQKLILYTNIVTNGNYSQIASPQIEEVKHFLEKIPPFPLDVSVAAYYLKATNSSYAVYLENIALYNKEFESLQETLLKEAGDYTKTRYGIISLSLQHIINTHKNFQGLLLLISLIDSQNIPRELLNNFKNNVVVDNFIFNLKKYSLLIHDPSNTALAIHRSTQAISLSYLIKRLDLEKNKELITSIAESLEKTMDEAIQSEDLAKMEALINPCEIFLSHERFLNKKIMGMLKSKLGTIHYFSGDNKKAKTLLEQSLLQLRDFYEESPTRIAYAAGFLGNVLRDLGDFNEAKLLLQKSLSIYNEHFMDDPLRHAYFAVYLGAMDIFLGHYDTARSALKKGFSIHAMHFPENENFSAWASEQLGTLERKLGNYKKAEALLEKSLLSFTKDYHNDMDIAWALQHLGIIYIKLKKYDKAKDTLEKSLKSWAATLPDKIGPLWILAHLDTSDVSGKHEDVKNLFDSLCKIYKGHFHENYIYAGLILEHLGNLYGKLENYEKAKVLLEQSQFIYETNYGKSHLATAPILNDLGEIYLLQGHIESAEDFMNKACLILEKNKHPDMHECLENLSKLYARKAAHELDKGKKEASQKLKMRAISYLNQALEVVKKYFPKNSPHEKRIQENLTAIEKKS